MDNSQSVPPGYKETDVGVIPKDWETERIGVLTNIVGGGTPSTDVARYWDGQIPWVSAGDVSRSNGRYVQNTAESISDLGLKSCSASIMPKGTTVIIARGATVGRMAQLASAMAFNQTCYGLLPIDGVDRNYLYYAMLYSVKSMKALTYGTIFGTITTNSFDQWQIPLPSPSEQRAIAEVLSDVDALIAALERLIAKKRAIKQGAMQQILTGKTRLPGFNRPWEIKTVGEVFRLLRTASNSRSDLSPDGTVKYIHYGDIHTLGKSVLDCESDDIPRIREHRLPKVPFLEDGDLIMVDASEDYGGIGTSVEVTNATGKRVVAGLHTLFLRGDKNLLADGFKGYIQFIPSFKNQLIEIATGTSVYGISKSKIQQLTISLPSLPEQRAIATVLSDMDAEIAALEARRDKTRALKQGMMQQLLTGRIRLV